MKLPQSLFEVDCILRNVFVLIGVFVLGIIAGYLLDTTYLRSAREQQVAKTTIYAFKLQAVKDRVGVWSHDESGAPEFKWKGCSALGVEK